MLIFLALTIWTFLGSLAVWARAKPRGAAVLLGGALIAAAQITGVMLVLGWLAGLRRELVLGLYVLLNATSIGFGHRELIGLYRHFRTDIHTGLLDLKHSKAALTVLSVTIALWLWTAWLGSLLPPTDFDGLAQHIPIAAFHLQSGSLARIDTPYRGIHAYPANGSLLIAWSMLVAGDDSLIDLAQWPFWLLGTLALYHLARCMGAGRANAVLGSAIFTAAPVVIMQARAAYVDLALAGLVLAGLALIFDRQVPVRSAAALVGCAAGVVMGLKYAGAIYAVMLGAGLLVRIYLERRGLLRLIVGDMIIALVPALALGGYWYLRNWFDLGNPFWPIGVQIGAVHLFDGVWTIDSFYQEALPASLAGLSYPLRLWTVWREPTAVYGPDVRLGGLGPLWFAVGLPCLVVYLAQTLRQRQRMGLGLLGFMCGAFFLTPANWHTRYVIAPIALSGVAVAAVLTHLDRWPRMALSALIMGLSTYSFVSTINRTPLTPLDIERFARLPVIERRVIFVDQAAAVGPAMRWFDRNVPEDSIVAYSWGGVVLYPFWQPASTRKMVYRPPSLASGWFDALRDVGAEYLVARQGSTEALAAEDDTRFRLIYADPTYAIYFLQ